MLELRYKSTSMCYYTNQFATIKLHMTATCGFAYKNILVTHNHNDNKQNDTHSCSEFVWCLVIFNYVYRMELLT